MTRVAYYHVGRTDEYVVFVHGVALSVYSERHLSVETQHHRIEVECECLRADGVAQIVAEGYVAVIVECFFFYLSVIKVYFFYFVHVSVMYSCKYTAVFPNKCHSQFT